MAFLVQPSRQIQTSQKEVAVLRVTPSSGWKPRVVCDNWAGEPPYRAQGPRIVNVEALRNVKMQVLRCERRLVAPRNLFEQRRHLVVYFDDELGVGWIPSNAFDPLIDGGLADGPSHDVAVEAVAPKLSDLRAPLYRRRVRSSDEPDLRDDDVISIVLRMLGAEVVQGLVADIPQRIAQGPFYEGLIHRFEQALAPMFAGLG
jgi:hypothetical protein